MSINFSSTGARQARLAAEKIKALQDHYEYRHLKRLLSLKDSLSGQEVWDNLAEKLYQDPSLGAKLAQANDCDYTQAPELGQQINVPPMLANHKRASTAEPYQRFMSEMIGSLYPHMIQHVDDDDSWFIDILMVIVMVVVAIVAPYAAAALYGVAVTAVSAVQLAITTLVLAAVADVMVQEIAVAMHKQKSINWKEVALTAITSAVSAGVMAPMANEAKVAISEILERTAVIAATNQLTAMALGLQHSFSWQNMLASVAAAYAEAELGGVATNSPTARAVASRFVGDMVDASISGQMPTMGHLAGDLIGADLQASIAENRKADKLKKEDAYWESELKKEADEVTPLGARHPTDVRKAGQEFDVDTFAKRHSRNEQQADAALHGKADTHSQRVDRQYYKGRQTDVLTGWTQPVCTPRNGPQMGCV